MAVCYFTVFSNLFKHDAFDFLGWMMVMYLIGGYIRMYQCELFESKKYSILCLMFSVALMTISVLTVDFLGTKIGVDSYYYMVADLHKILALTCSVSAFLLFKNIRISRSEFINQIASSTFGILLIHTNSETMRRFLWKDVFHNTSFYESKLLALHLFGSVFDVYLVCLIIGQLRKKYIEKPFFIWLDQTGWLTKLSQRRENI